MKIDTVLENQSFTPKYSACCIKVTTSSHLKKMPPPNESAILIMFGANNKYFLITYINIDSLKHSVALVDNKFIDIMGSRPLSTR